MITEKLVVIAAGSLAEKGFSFFRLSDDLSRNILIPFSSTGVVSCPAVEGRVHLAVELAQVVLVEDCDVSSFVRAPLTFLFAGLASVRCSRFSQNFVHSRAVSAAEVFVGDRIDHLLYKIVSSL